MDTNNHNDFFAIGKLQPLQTNNIIYGFVRLFNGIQVIFSHSFHSQCAPPEIKRIDFYSQNDRYFGSFLRDLCFNSRAVCAKQASADEVMRSPKCQKPLFLHTTCILHGGFCLHVTSSSVGTGRNTSASVRGWR